MHVMSVEYLRPMMGASPSSDQLQQQLSQNTRGHCRPSTREGGKGGAHRARALSAAARGPHLSTRNPRPKESARPGGGMSKHSGMSKIGGSTQMFLPTLMSIFVLCAFVMLPQNP